MKPDPKAKEEKAKPDPKVKVEPQVVKPAKDQPLKIDDKKKEDKPEEKPK